jgi:hypothetical protein
MCFCTIEQHDPDNKSQTRNETMVLYAVLNVGDLAVQDGIIRAWWGLWLYALLHQQLCHDNVFHPTQKDRHYCTRTSSAHNFRLAFHREKLIVSPLYIKNFTFFLFLPRGISITNEVFTDGVVLQIANFKHSCDSCDGRKTLTNI